MSKVFVPPIKCQGIKTKLVDWILKQVSLDDDACWSEPFMGSGVVGFNLRPKNAVFADENPHLINFYRAIQSGEITSVKAKRSGLWPYGVLKPPLLLKRMIPLKHERLRNRKSHGLPL